MYGTILIFIIIAALISKIIQDIRDDSFRYDSYQRAKAEGKDIYYDGRGKPWYKNKRCAMHTDINNGHNVCRSLDGKTIYRDFTQEKIDKQWENFNKEYAEKKKKALLNGRNSVYVNYPGLGYITIELSTGKRIRKMKGVGSERDRKYYKYYYDSFNKNANWIDGKIQITKEEFYKI